MRYNIHIVEDEGTISTGRLMEDFMEAGGFAQTIGGADVIMVAWPMKNGILARENEYLQLVDGTIGTYIRDLMKHRDKATVKFGWPKYTSIKE